MLTLLLLLLVVTFVLTYDPAGGQTCRECVRVCIRVNTSWLEWAVNLSWWYVRIYGKARCIVLRYTACALAFRP